MELTSKKQMEGKQATTLRLGQALTNTIEIRTTTMPATINKRSRFILHRESDLVNIFQEMVEVV